MRKLTPLLLLCGMIFSACSTDYAREKVVNIPEIPVRVYSTALHTTDAEGNPLDSNIFAAFDNRIETAWKPSCTTIITLTCNMQYVTTIRMYEVNDVRISIYSDKNKNSALTTIDSTTVRDDGWIDVPINSTIQDCVLEVEPLSANARVAHIELWGTTQSASDVFVHLHNATTQLVYAAIDTQSVDVFEARGNEGGSYEVTIPNPWKYRRMYIVFESDAFRPISVILKVNECDWLGGLTIPEAAGNSGMRQHSVEVNAQWFVPGKNTLYFKNNGQELSHKNIRVVAVKDTGYNEELQAESVLADADITTAMDVGQGAIVTAERPMRVYGALVYMHSGTASVKVQHKEKICRSRKCDGTHAGVALCGVCPIVYNESNSSGR